MNQLFVIILLLSGSILGVWAQNNEFTKSENTQNIIPRDNIYKRFLHQERKIIQYDFIQEKDVFW